MTDKEINLIIAETCGWKHCGDSLCGFGGCPPRSFRIFGPEQEEDWRHRYGKKKGDQWYPIPNYCEDLNAMYEVEQHMFYGMDMYGTSRFSKIAYKKYLHMESHGRTWHTTARERAIALVKSMGKWKE